MQERDEPSAPQRLPQAPSSAAQAVRHREARGPATSQSDRACVPPLRVRARAYLIGLGGTVLVDLWIHYAELVLGGARGHSALANTSIPLGAFCALFAVVLLNQGLRRSAPR